jgi:hypothetical protein
MRMHDGWMAADDARDDLGEARSALVSVVLRRIGTVTAADVASALEDLCILIATLEPHEEPQRVVLRALADLLLGEAELREAEVEAELWEIIDAASGHGP